MKKKQSIGIHDGTFHADEVTACALLVLFGLVEPDKIVRTRDSDLLATCEFVCDVGGVYDSSQKLFDHHQASYQGDLSGAGMILNYLREQKVISEAAFEHFNRTIILGVDAHDNGRSTQEVGVCTFSHVIANFNPIEYDASKEKLDLAFTEALKFTIGHLRRIFQRFNYTMASQKLVQEAMEGGSVCLFFDRALPWLESFFALGGESHPALFVVMPAAGHWKLRAIPPSYERRMQVRIPLPKQWAGLLGKELEEVSQIEGAVFCHKGRFTSVWETRSSAIKALKYVLNQNKVTYEDSF